MVIERQQCEACLSDARYDLTEPSSLLEYCFLTPCMLGTIACAALYINNPTSVQLWNIWTCLALINE